MIYNYWSKFESNSRFEPYSRPVKELLLAQSKGETLTREEKETVIKYANAQRKKNQSKK